MLIIQALILFLIIFMVCISFYIIKITLAKAKIEKKNITSEFSQFIR